MNQPRQLWEPKFIIAYTIIIGFASAYVHSPDDTMKGALIAAFAGAWGFYLGSANSSHTLRDQVGQALGLAKDAAQGNSGDGAEKGAKAVAKAADDKAEEFTDPLKKAQKQMEAPDDV